MTFADAKNMIVTRMDGPEDSDPTEKRSPSWVGIEVAIRRLDGEGGTLACLGIGVPPVPPMAIGGGKDGRCIVYCTGDNEAFDNLAAPQAPPGKLLLKAGEQLGDYEPRRCVSDHEALLAAKTYMEGGAADTKMTWEKQG